jgi:hypothetical protein
MKNKMDENRKEMEKIWKMNENNAHMENKIDETRYQMEKKMNEMKKSMNENKEEIQKSMKTLETILLQRIPNRDMEIQGNHENKENNGVEIRSHMGSILSHLESTNTESQSQDHSLLQDPHHQGFMSTPRNHFIPNIYMSKFDGKDPITMHWPIFVLHKPSRYKDTSKKKR